MGLVELVAKEGRARRARGTKMKRGRKKEGESAERLEGMQKLREIGSDEAILGLARRFSYVYDKLSEDEQEKEWVCESLIGMGERAVAPLRAYAKGAESLSWPLRVLEKIAGKDTLLAVVDEVLARDEPGYTRNPTRKIQVLTWLGEWKGASDREIAARIVPYLADFDETVRFTAADAVSHHRDEETLRAPLLDALLRPEEESRRIKVRAAEVLADAGCVVTDRKEAVARLLAEELAEFGMQHDKLVRPDNPDKKKRERR